MFMTKRHSTTYEAGHTAKCHHQVSRDIMLCLGAETWPKNDGKKTGGWGKLGFIDPLFHIVNCSWIWNPPPRDLLHKQKKLGKSLGRFYVIRFVFYGAELFLGFEIPTQRKIKLLKFSWQVLLALLNEFFVPFHWSVKIEIEKSFFFNFLNFPCVSWNNDILHILIENWCRQSGPLTSEVWAKYERSTFSCIRLI